MPAAQLDSQNAFKGAEKHYQLHQTLHLKRGNRSSQQHTIDLSDVVDVLGRVPACQGSTDALQLLSLPGHIPMPSAAEGMFQGTHAYSLHSCPGCIVFPGWLTAEAQLRLAADAFCCFPEPPARTNHNAQYGGLKGLWHAAQADKVLESVHGPGERPCEWHWTDSVSQHRNKRGGFRPEVLPARRLLRHLRWASLGPQYDWSARVYRHSTAAAPLPAYLKALASHFAALAAASRPSAPSPLEHRHPTTPSSTLDTTTLTHSTSHTTAHPGSSCHAEMGASGTQNAASVSSACTASAGHSSNTCGGGFAPDAALVNYYWQGDTLNGHQDNVEPDMSQPIVALSVGCDGVFLMGGRTKADKPVALLLRSGDVVAMTAPARLCFHGVPRVLPEHPLPPELQQAGAAGSSAVQTGGSGIEAADRPPSAEQLLATLQQCRLNLSVRHTAPPTNPMDGQSR